MPRRASILIPPDEVAVVVCPATLSTPATSVHLSMYSSAVALPISCQVRLWFAQRDGARELVLYLEPMDARLLARRLLSAAAESDRSAHG
jgi:hypothetical protein